MDEEREDGTLVEKKVICGCNFFYNFLLVFSCFSLFFKEHLHLNENVATVFKK
jgi:hypothetical protein